jgi:hypothetical protein
MTTEGTERMTDLEKILLWCNETDATTPEGLQRFADLIRADALAGAHAALDATGAGVIRNAIQGYPGGREPLELTLVERIAALGLYAADYKRWLLEAEAASERTRAVQAAREPVAWGEIGEDQQGRPMWVGISHEAPLVMSHRFRPLYAAPA